MMPRILRLSNPCRRQLSRHNPRINSFTGIQLRAEFLSSKAAAVRVLNTSENNLVEQYSIEEFKPTIIQDVVADEQEMMLHLSDENNLVKEYSIEELKPTIIPVVVSDEPQDMILHVSDELQLADYVACTLPHPLDKAVYVPPTVVVNSNEEKSLFDGLTSRPVKGGNWNPDAPLKWSQAFGRRSAEMAQRLEKLVKLGPGDDGYFDVSNMKVPGVTIVRTKEEARIVLEKLNAAPHGTFHACDTEVMEIDLKTVGPVGNGYVTCVSIHSGPHFDYGLGDGKGATLWIDNLDDSVGLLQEFKDWFQDPKHLKVWHHYGFDRHVMWNEGIDCRGFGGDTMHMARLQDTSRSKLGAGTGYSLEGLSAELLDRKKVSMKEIFGVKRLRKDGSEGLLSDIPPIEVMQRNPMHRHDWIEYSAYDAQGTWLLREKLQQKLQELSWIGEKNLYNYYEMYMCAFGEVLTDMERRGIRVDARDYLAGVEVQARKDRERHIDIFRYWAAKQIGPDGLAINTGSSLQLCTFLFGGGKNEISKMILERERVFKVAREEIPQDALEAFRLRDLAEATDSPPEKDEFDRMTAVQLKSLLKDLGLKLSGKKAELQERLRGHYLTKTGDVDESSVGSGDNFDAMSDEDLCCSLIGRGLDITGTRKQRLDRLREDSAFTLELISASNPSDRNGYEKISQALKAAADRDGGNLQTILAEVQKKAGAISKSVDVKITGIGMTPVKYTSGGAPSATADVIRTLAGDPFRENPKFGTAYDFFGGGDAGREACEALYSLGAVGSIDTMIANFLTSLQLLADDSSRVHGSVNLNTETGRLSSRRPNLQNQPALEKDTYKIRKAFQASPGNNLIVADYGQLELRLLASMTNCESMINAFHAGGDFHSRTALDMFDYVRKAVDSGECLLEWDYSKGDPPKPMLKDMFASERRKAKTLNFSIAYGKTAHGLSQDWGVSRDEAEQMLKAWYNARPEVLKWQTNTKAYANQMGVTRTLMGRYRQLPGARVKNDRLLRSHNERASINTPIQGGAADVAMMAMIKINDSEKLKRLGWILLMQIHDEVILEGPEETAEEAFSEVMNCMENPWVFGLRQTAVPLLVDGSYEHKNWYDAK